MAPNLKSRASIRCAALIQVLPRHIIEPTFASLEHSETHPKSTSEDRAAAEPETCTGTEGGQIGAGAIVGNRCRSSTCPCTSTVAFTVIAAGADITRFVSRTELQPVLSLLVELGEPSEKLSKRLAGPATGSSRRYWSSADSKSCGDSEDDTLVLLQTSTYFLLMPSRRCSKVHPECLVLLALRPCSLAHVRFSPIVIRPPPSVFCSYLNFEGPRIRTHCRQGKERPDSLRIVIEARRERSQVVETNGLARGIERKAVVRLPQAATEDYSRTLRLHPSGVGLPLAAGVRTYHLVRSDHCSPSLSSGLPARSAVR